MRARTAPVAALLFGSGFCALVYQVGWLREFRLIFGASTRRRPRSSRSSSAASASAACCSGRAPIAIPGRCSSTRTLEVDRRGLRRAQPAAADARAHASTSRAADRARSALAAATVERLLLSVARARGADDRDGRHAAGRGARRHARRRRPAPGSRDALRARTRSAPSPAAWSRRSSCSRSTARARRSGSPPRSTSWSRSSRARSIGRRLERTGEAVTSARRQTRRSVDPARPHRDLPCPARDLPDLPDLSAHRVGDRRLRVLPDGARLVPAARAAARRIGLHVRPRARGRARRASASAGCSTRWSSSDRPATLAGFAATCLLEAAAVALTFALGDRVALLALALLPLGAAGFAATIAGWTLVTAIVVLPPALVAGYQFPLLIALFGRGRERVGRDVGLAYAANTAGAIVGSLAGGFGLLPWLSAPGAWRLVALVLVALGVAAAVLDSNADARSAAHRGLGVAACVLVRARARRGHAAAAHRRGPDGDLAPQRHRRRPRAARRPRRRRTSSARGSRPSAARSSGTATASRAASRWPSKQTGYAFIVNGKSDGSARGDAGTQVMLGLLGALAHPAAAPRAGHRPRHRQHRRLARRRSRRWSASTSSSSSRWCSTSPAPARRSTTTRMHNPKVHVTIGDARETLLTTARPLRRHRVRAVQSVPRRHRQPVHGRSSTAPRARG